MIIRIFSPSSPNWYIQRLEQFLTTSLAEGDVGFIVLIGIMDYDDDEYGEFFDLKIPIVICSCRFGQVKEKRE